MLTNWDQITLLKLHYSESNGWLPQDRVVAIRTAMHTKNIHIFYCVEKWSNSFLPPSHFNAYYSSIINAMHFLDFSKTSLS